MFWTFFVANLVIAGLIAVPTVGFVVGVLLLEHDLIALGIGTWAATVVLVCAVIAWMRASDLL